MALTPNHGTRIIDAGDTERPILIADQSPAGIVLPASNADASVFPLNEPVHFFTNDAAKLEALGIDNPASQAVAALLRQGITASVVFVRVEEGADLETTVSNIVGDAAAKTGVHALRHARGHTGVEPGLLFSPGFTSQRIGGQKNPVMAELGSVAADLKSIAIGDCPRTSNQEAFQYRADFSDRYTYLIEPGVTVFEAGETVVQPASAYAAGLFMKRDAQRGGPYFSPSNQAILGITGTSRPISYFDGEINHDANFLNNAGINTIIPSTTIQSATGAVASNGTILWGSETTSADPLWRFVNVVRTRATIEKAVVRAMRPFIDGNIRAQQIVAVQRSLQIFLDQLTAVGAILGGRAEFQKALNSGQALRSGTVRIEMIAEEAPPLNDLIIGSRRDAVYFDILVNDILAEIGQAA
ncbi:MAG: phage tail sheath subtilisin-like domain-containing protein [Rhizobiales bacterium]|nr:phage tail sheath subtilisin-like domain-containing protein [Hyphomicrobiales bacterium]